MEGEISYPAWVQEKKINSKCIMKIPSRKVKTTLPTFTNIFSKMYKTPTRNFWETDMALSAWWRHFSDPDNEVNRKFKNSHVKLFSFFFRYPWYCHFGCVFDSFGTWWWIQRLHPSMGILLFLDGLVFHH